MNMPKCQVTESIASKQWYKHKYCQTSINVTEALNEKQTQFSLLRKEKQEQEKRNMHTLSVLSHDTEHDRGLYLQILPIVH